MQKQELTCIDSIGNTNKIKNNRFKILCLLLNYQNELFIFTIQIYLINIIIFYMISIIIL